jgi:hypothetical protein
MPCLSACRNFDSTLVSRLSDDECFISCNISSNTPNRMIPEASALYYRGSPTQVVKASPSPCWV